MLRVCSTCACFESVTATEAMRQVTLCRISDREVGEGDDGCNDWTQSIDEQIKSLAERWPDVERKVREIMSQPDAAWEQFRKGKL